METLALLTINAPSALSPSIFADIPYSPDLLLDAHFGSHITDDPEFSRACQSNFDTYFEVMYQPDASGDGVQFVERFYTLPQVYREVCEDLFQTSPCAELPSLAWRVGFVLGWLSALALVQREEALKGLAIPRCLVGSSVVKEAAA